MLLADLLIAHHITGRQRYLDFYQRVLERFKDNPDPLAQNRRSFSLERVARVNHRRHPDGGGLQPGELSDFSTALPKS
jgi:hypothetical protein